MPKHRVLTEFGMGTSLRRQDYTQAARRALQDALWHNAIDAADVWFRRAPPAVRTEFGIPPLAVQRTSRSDIARSKWHHRLPGGRQLGGWVRRKFRP